MWKGITLNTFVNSCTACYFNIVNHIMICACYTGIKNYSLFGKFVFGFDYVLCVMNIGIRDERLISSPPLLLQFSVESHPLKSSGKVVGGFPASNRKC